MCCSNYQSKSVIKNEKITLLLDIDDSTLLRNIQEYDKHLEDVRASQFIEAKQ
jgi:hypothetical protein